MKVFGTYVSLVALLGLLGGCHSGPQVRAPRRTTDEIIVAGQRFHTGTPVVTWLDAAGYNAYQQPFSPRGKGKTPAVTANHTRRAFSPHAAAARTTLAALQETVDQFVLHYDVCGLSKICFNVLQQRRLSTHFLLDIDGTIYQTLDLQERALHATVSNNRSIGIEIAQVGAYPPGDSKLLDEWYQRDATGRPFIQVPARIAQSGVFTQPFTGRPARPVLVRGRIQNTALQQYDFTPEQYAALSQLIATLCRVFPRIKCDYPSDAQGRLITHQLPDAALAKYQGVLGHYHIQKNKYDPGPALQWEYLIRLARGQGH